MLRLCLIMQEKTREMFCWKWEQTDSLDEEEVAIVMEIPEVIRRAGKISYQHLKMWQGRNCYRRLLRLIKF